jgi:hypothetical protein
MKSKKMKLIKITLIIIFFTFFLLWLPFLDKEALSDTNLIANPSFEIFSGLIPGNWKFVTIDGNSPIIDIVSHSGVYSIKISILGTADNESGSPRSDLIKAEPLQNYTFTAWGKTDNAGGTNAPAVRVVELDANKNWLTQTNLVFNMGTNNWTQKQTNFQTRSDTAYLYVYADIWNGYGTFWVDDVDLRIKETFSIPSTLTPTSSRIGSNYFVASNGNDENPGTEQSPWRSITKAANIMVAGDIVYVKQGIYNEKVIVQNSGSSGKYITFAAFPGDIVTIDGAGISLPNWYGLVNILGKNYINISGFKVINSEFSGIFVSKDDNRTPPSNIIIEKNYIDNTLSSGIMVIGESFNPATNIILDGNEVVRAQVNGQTSNECITIGFNVDIFEIKNNVVHNCPTEGIDVKAGVSNGKIFGNHVYDTSSSGIYVDAWDSFAKDIDVYNNNVHDQRLPWGGGFDVSSEKGGTVENVRFYNNIAYNNPAAGIAIGWVSSGPVRNITIIGNTFYGNGDGTDWGGGIDIVYANAQNVLVRNNIVSQNNNYQINYPNRRSDVIVDHNLIDGLENKVGSYYVSGNPQFVNPKNGDFHLKSTSSAIDKGSPNDSPNVDFEGNHRPMGSGYDIGAFEFVK